MAAASHPPVHRRVMLFVNIPGRILATVLFWQEARNVALWEALWCTLNAAALRFTL